MHAHANPCRPSRRPLPLSAWTGLAASAAILAACADDSVPTAILADGPAPDATAAFLASGIEGEAWSGVVNLGDAINSPVSDAHPTVSTDGLSLYFTGGNQLGGEGRRDIWVSRRASRSDAWGSPVNLGPGINTGDHDDNPTLSHDGRSLYFSSDRDGQGGFDLWVAHRDDPADDLGWGTPVNLGAGVNSAADERDAEPFQDPGRRALLYFASNRAGSSDIWMASLGSDGAWTDAEPVQALSGAAEDESPTISRDGRTVYFASDRSDPGGRRDIWVATRLSSTHAWRPPVLVGPPVSLPESNDVGPDLSVDGGSLYFSSAFRTGNEGGVMYDLWVARR